MTGRSGSLTLRHRLAEAEATIEALLAGQVDAVVDSRSTTPILLAKAQEAMEHSRQRLQDIIDGLAPSVFVSLLTADGTVIESNLPPTLGRTADEILGKPIDSTFWNSDSPAGRERLRQAVALATRGEPSRYDTHVRAADGAAIDIDFSLQPLLDASGQVVGMVASATAITDRKRAELQLRESEANYRALVEWSPESIAVSRHGTVLFANPAAVKMLGAANTTELIGRPIAGFIHPDSRPAAVDRLRYLAASGGALPMVNERVVRLDGTMIEVEIQARTINFQGEPAVLASMRDVTERHRSATALQASVEEFRTLAEAMPQMVWITEPNGANIYFNQQWVVYTGLTLAESYGSGWVTPFHPDDQDRARVAWEAAVATVGVYRVECRLRRRDGEYRWWLIRGIPHRNADGLVTKWFGTCTDIHDLKQGELEILRSNRALKLLSGCGQVLIHAETEADLLDRFCQLAVDLGGYRLAWVGYALDDEARTIEPMAHAGRDSGFLSTLEVTWRAGDPRGEGPSGTAIRSGRAVVRPDVTTAALPAWSDLARSHDLAGAIALPLRSAERTFGMLTMYSTEAVTTTADELTLLQEVADNLAFGIASQRARAEQRRLHSAVLRVAAGVSASSGTDFFQHLVRNMAEALGAQGAFVSRVLGPDAVGGSTLAAVVDGKDFENFEYVFADTPCEHLSRSESVIITGGAAEQFPLAKRLVGLRAEGYVGQRLENSLGEIVGHLFVVFTEPLAHVEFITSTLRIFAARAASELERRHTDDRIREQAALLDVANEAISVRDMDGRILYWNKGAERTFGWESPEVLGRSSIEVLGADPVAYAAAHAAVVTHGEWQGELTKHAKDGRALAAEVRWTLVRHPDGAPKSILAIDSDITKRKALEAQFLRAQRMEGIGTLAGGIAHDLNNVLSPIMLSVEMLRALATAEADHDVLDMLVDSARRGAALVQQVLAFGRGIDGERLPVNPVSILTDLLKIMRETFPKSITVHLAPAHDAWTVIGDTTQLHQVFLNLCVNARDAMPAGGRLSVALANVMVDETYAASNEGAVVGPYVKVTVRDTGTGISPETRDRIFEPFFTTKEFGKGTGLGLSTTMAIVKSHGGFIALTSELHQGTTFSVYLPAEPSGAVESPVPATPTLPRGSGELVLLVDDEEPVRRVAQQTLERFGYRVLVTANGAEAVAMYATRMKEIRVVVTDMAMPIMDGPATIGALKAINPAVKIVASSGLTTADAAARAGATHFLPKPYTADALLRLLDQVLRGGTNVR